MSTKSCVNSPLLIEMNMSFQRRQYSYHYDELSKQVLNT